MKHLFNLILFWSISILSFGNDNKVIIKLKWESRLEINNPDLIKVLDEFGSYTIQKTFPSHTFETDRKGSIKLATIYTVTYATSFQKPLLLKRLSKFNFLEYAQSYPQPKLCYTPSDTLLSQQYYLNLVQALNAWDINKGDTAVTIAITDTGWDPAHPDLINNIQRNYNDPVNGADDDNDGYVDNFMGWDIAMNDNDATFESLSHGVNVTGIAAATTDNVTGISGVGFRCRFLPVKISNAAGILTSAYQGVVYAADHNADIINCSWGSFTAGQFQQDVINYALSKGCLIVAAVGNNNQDVKFYPAAYKGVFSVCATEQNDLKKDNSNFGYYVDIAAPGEAMFTTTSAGSYMTNGGTSMAAPVVSGGAALVKAANPSFTADQIKALLKLTANDIYGINPNYNYKLGSGRLNLYNALTVNNPQYVSVTYDSLYDTNDQNFYDNDTINIFSVFKNMLSPVTGFSVQLISLSPYANVLNGSFSTSNTLNTLDTVSNFNNIFKIEIAANAPLNETVVLQYQITVNGTTYYEYVEFVVNPDYITVSENNITTTFCSNGRIGYNDANNTQGEGFIYKNNNLLYEAGLMISDNTPKVADCVRGTNGPDFDFSSLVPIHYSTNAVADVTLDGMMEDFYLTDRLFIDVYHNEYVYNSPPYQNCVITAYTIENKSTVTFGNLYCGIFADWDISDAYNNKANADISRKLSYCYSTQDSLYAGIMLLNNVPFNTYNIDNVSGGNGGVDIYGDFTSNEKYTTLTTLRQTAGNTSPTGNDVCQVVSTGVANLAPGENFTAVFALLAGDSLQQLLQNADSIQNYYNQNPVFVNEQTNIGKISFYPNPVKDILHLNGINKTKEYNFFIYDISGKIVLKGKTDDSIYLSNLNKGIYFIKVFIEETFVIKKFIKQ